MPRRDDIYRNEQGIEARLCVPLLAGDLDDECRFGASAILSLAGAMFAKLEPWPPFREPVHSLYSEPVAYAGKRDNDKAQFEFCDEDQAAECAHEMLIALGFIPASGS